MNGNNIRSKISIFERITSLNLRQSNIQETEIIPRIVTINSSSYEKTNTYLKTKEKFIFFNFDEQKEIFKNEIRFNDRLSLEECISFVFIAKFWLNVHQNAQIIIRNSKKSYLGLYFACFLRLTENSEYTDAQKLINTKLLISELPNHCFFGLFENYLQNLEFKNLNLHQIVITTIPKKKNDSEKPFLKPFYSLRILERPMIPNVQHDENHIICRMDVIVRSDVTVEFYRNSSKLFTIFINTIGFDEGLYRFTAKDCMIEPDTFISNDFSVDIIFFNTRERPKIINFDPKAQISDRLVGVYDRKIYDQYKKIGYKHEDAIFLSLTSDFQDNALLEEKIDEEIELRERNEDDYIGMLRPYEPDDTIELLDLDFIKDFIPEKSNPKSSKRKMAPIRKNKENKDDKNEEDVVVRPFYWAVIPKSCDSIFNELRDVRTYIDCTKLEEWFSVTTENRKFHIEKQKGSVIKDSRRLFLISISLKTFEKRELTLNAPFLNKMTLDDLVIIERVMPTEDEYTLLCSDQSGCNEIESKMIEFYQFNHLVKVLLFERRFFEIKDKWMTAIINIKNGFDEILQSNNIRILLKIVLEIGNLINTNYGNNRKTACAFKLTSLILTKNYKGNQKNQSLLTFIADAAKSRLRNFQRELDMLEMLEKEDFTIYRTAINDYILDYTSLKETLPDLDDYSRPIMKAFFLYFAEYIKKFKSEYRETMIYASIIKRKFGEPEEKKVKEIIKSLNEFLKLIHDEISLNIN